MKKLFRKVFWGLSFLFMIMNVVGCSHDKQSVDTSLKEAAKTAKEYVNDNDFIEIKDFQEKIRTANSMTSNDDVKMHVAVYRFYSHVKLEDDQYVTDLTKGSEINISSELFTFLKDGIEEANKNVRESKKAGKKTVIMDITSEYLDSLLK